MTIDEAIKRAEEVAEENETVANTRTFKDGYTVDEMYCDDTECINEHLARCAKCGEEHRQLAEWLKELKQLREQTNWIPVSERLPEKAGGYLVTSSINLGEKSPVMEIHIDYFCKSSRKWLYEGEDVIAWKPLPEAYKEEGED